MTYIALLLALALLAAVARSLSAGLSTMGPAPLVTTKSKQIASVAA